MKRIGCDMSPDNNASDSDHRKISRLISEAARAEELITYEELEQASWELQRMRKVDSTEGADTV